MSSAPTLEERRETLDKQLARLDETVSRDGLYITTVRIEVQCDPADSEAVVAEVRALESEFDLLVGVVLFPGDDENYPTSALCAFVGSRESVVDFLHVFYNIPATPTREQEPNHDINHPDAENIRSGRRHNHDR